MDTAAASRATELGEAAYLSAMFEHASPDVRRALGLSHGRVGGAVVTVMANDPTSGYWSRVVGLGFDEPVTETLIDGILDFARQHGARSLIFQISPWTAGAWEDVLSERGALPGTAWVKFAAELPVAHPAASTDLRIGRVGPDDAAEFAEVFICGFGMPDDPHLARWIAATASMPGFRGYAGRDGARIVAVANSFTADGRTALCGAATLPEARRRGAQSALMAARLRDAAAAGSAWITCETHVETEQSGPNPSLHNMRRMGFTELYERRNWRWNA